MRPCLSITALVIALTLVGCSENKPAAVPSVNGSKYLLTSEPADAQGVREARKKTKDGDDVVIVGRIGGQKNPWGNGQASFSLVDVALPTCSERPGDTCDTPWDYCCEDPKDILAALATVKIVNDKGDTVQTPAHELLGVKETQTVVVRGKAKRDDKGNLTVLATGLYVRSEKK